jgi:hypothetical protein
MFLKNVVTVLLFFSLKFLRSAWTFTWGELGIVILLKSTDSNSWNERHLVHWLGIMLAACLNNIMHTLWWCYLSVWIWILHTYSYWVLWYGSHCFILQDWFFYIKISWKTVLIHWLEFILYSSPLLRLFNIFIPVFLSVP